MSAVITDADERTADAIVDWWCADDRLRRLAPVELVPKIAQAIADARERAKRITAAHIFDRAEQYDHSSGIYDAMTQVAASIAEIDAERDRQDRLHPGTSRIPDGTGERWAWLEWMARGLAEREVANGGPTHATVLLEEVAEALAATTVADMRKEIVQAAACCVKWLEDIDRREFEETP